MAPANAERDGVKALTTLADFERRAALLAEVVDYVTFDSSALIMPKPRQIAMLSVRFDADRTRW